MIDTLRFKISGMGFQRPAQWKQVNRILREVTDDGEGESTMILAEDPESGFRIGGASEDFTQWAELSVPRLVKGRNSIVLRVDEVQEAVDKAVARIKACHTGFFRVEHLTRVDCCAQFEGRAGDWIPAHRTAKHPRVRKNTTEWFGESLHWPGREVHGRLYDKLKEEGKPPGNVMRMEWQMRGKALQKAYTGNGNRKVEVQHLTGARAYQVFRDMTLPLQPQPLAKAGSIAALLALGQRLGWKDEADRDVLDIWLCGKSRVTGWRTRKLVSGERPQYWNIDWNELLPENPDRAPIVYDAWDMEETA